MSRLRRKWKMGRVAHEHTAQVLDNMVAGLGADTRTPVRPSHPSGRWVKCTISLRPKFVAKTNQLPYPQELDAEVRFSNLREPMSDDLTAVESDVRGIGIRVMPSNGEAPFELTGISQPIFIADTRLGFMTATTVQRLIGPASEHGRVRSIARAAWLVLTGLYRRDISLKAMRVAGNPPSTPPLQSTYFGVHTFFYNPAAVDNPTPFRYRIEPSSNNSSVQNASFTIFADVLRSKWKHLISVVHEPEPDQIERTIEIGAMVLTGPVHTSAPSGRADSINPMRLPANVEGSDDDEILALRHSVYEDSFLRRTAALDDAQTRTGNENDGPEHSR